MRKSRFTEEQKVGAVRGAADLASWVRYWDLSRSA
jgi:hypothetical protein